MNRRHLAVLAVVAVAVALGLAAVTGAQNLTPNSGPGSNAVTDDGTSIRYQGESLTFDAAPEQTIRGETNRSAGTELVVRLRSASGVENPFIKSTTATVDESGAYAARFDLSEIDSDTSFEVTVRHEGSELVTAVGTIE